MPNLEGIDIFVKIVEAGGFTAAARALGMPVTTVSGQLKALEKRLGATLLLRTTRRVGVTEIGRQYFEHCVKAVAEVQAGERALRAGQTEPEGNLRVTAAPDIGHHVLPALVSTYLTKYPKTRVELVLTNRTLDLLAEGIDVAIRPGPLRDSTLLSRRFKETETHIWAAPGYLKRRGTPTTPEELAHHVYVGFKPFAGAPLTDGRRAKPIPVAPRIEVDDFEAVKVFVARGFGLGALPDLICQDERAKGRLVQLLPEWKIERAGKTRGTLHLVYPPQPYVAPKLAAFLSLAEGMKED